MQNTASHLSSDQALSRNDWDNDGQAIGQSLAILGSRGDPWGNNHFSS